MIRNLKKYGAGRNQLLDVYMKQCRSVFELAVPVWNTGLSTFKVKQLERTKRACGAEGERTPGTAHLPEVRGRRCQPLGAA